MADLFTALTGINKSPAELMKNAERAWNVERAFNTREGWGKKEDMGPERWSSESIKGKEGVFSPVTPPQLDALLTDFYDECGWDTETGLPTKQKLEGLGLEDIAKDLELAGRL